MNQEEKKVETNENIVFENNALYLYVKREKKPPIEVKYIAEILATKGKNKDGSSKKKKKHLFIVTASQEKFTISCDAVRAKNFTKL